MGDMHMNVNRTADRERRKVLIQYCTHLALEGLLEKARRPLYLREYIRASCLLYIKLGASVKHRNKDRFRTMPALRGCSISECDH